jgi:hypothetical protein
MHENLNTQNLNTQEVLVWSVYSSLTPVLCIQQTSHITVQNVFESMFANAAHTYTYIHICLLQTYTHTYKYIYIYIYIYIHTYVILMARITYPRNHGGRPIHKDPRLDTASAHHPHCPRAACLTHDPSAPSEMQDAGVRVLLAGRSRPARV